MSSIFPTEIYFLIIDQLGLPHRRDLAPFLVVCRQFHDIIIPLLYESITLPPSNQFDLTRFGPATIMPTRSSFNKFLSTISRNPALAAHVISFINYGRGVSSIVEESAINQAITYLTHLKCLYFDSPFSITDFLPQTVALTHFVFKASWTRFVYQLIRSQPSIQYLTLGPASFMLSLSLFPTIALPNLTSLTCRPDFLSKIEGLPPIKHLVIETAREILAPDRPRPRLPVEIIRGVKSLSATFPTLVEVASYCESLEFLWVVTPGDIDNTLLTRIPSRSLKYLHYTPNKFSLDNRTLFFETFPHLMFFDMDDHVLGVIARVLRFPEKPNEVRIARIPSADQFEHWHELSLMPSTVQ
ncbi:hypothetical protein ONZ45_g10614 [Pleurotus djamor]|nr:hypothetical protein ONZ45_g10614 [Pleurotus djamor]